MVVIVLMSLLAGLGGSLYTGSFKRMQVEKAAKGLFVMARYARIAAIEHQRPYDLVLDRKNNQCLLITTIQDKETFEAKETIVKNGFCKPEVFPKEVTFQRIHIESAESELDSEPKVTVTFMPNGTADTALIQLGNEQTHYTVAIACATGKASLMTGSAPDLSSLVVDLDTQGL